MAIKVSSNSEDTLMSELNVTPLVDVMLVLLVIFIVTAPLLTPQVLSISLPTTKTVPGVDVDKQNQLLIGPTGQLQFNGQSVNEEELTKHLKELAISPRAKLQIAADQQVPYGRVAQVMALAQSQGVVRLTFLTQTNHKK